MASTKDEQVAKSLLSSGRRQLDRLAMYAGRNGRSGRALYEKGATDALRKRGYKYLAGATGVGIAGGEMIKRHSSARDGLQGRSSGSM